MCAALSERVMQERAAVLPGGKAGTEGPRDKGKKGGITGQVRGDRRRVRRGVAGFRTGV